jgi:transcriptional regulator with XRE-family HTH domain
VDVHTLGQRIRQAREARGLSQDELAVLISRDQRAVSEYERGVRKIAVTDLPTFADALGVPLAYFYEDEPPLDEWDSVLLREFRRLPTLKAKRTAIDFLRAFAAFLAE